MKYPEQCYRIGNEFAFESVKILSSSISKGIIWSSRGFEFKEEECALIGITAETLAESARENGYDLLVEFGAYIRVYACNHKHKLRDAEEIRSRTNESLGEFFLRVAKERNYIQ